MNILAIIPAKLDSTRLEKKNLKKIHDKSLVEYSIDYAKQSKYNPTIIISSESDEVLKIAMNNKVTFVERPPHLLKDAEVVDVYLDIVTNVVGEYDLVVCLQPDNPDRSHTFDECIEYMIDNNYDDLITVNPEYKRSGSVRIFKFNYLKAGQVSKRLGCIKDNATDIHYQEDLETVTKKIK